MIRKTLTPAASYVRMSSGKQERSPAQQRGEIKKLAKSEGCEIVNEFSDEAVSGDSGPEQRPGFRAMLESAERGEFSVLLLENGDRLGRFDSISGAEHYNRLRQAGIRIVTASDGVIDLDSFEGRVVHTVRQEGRHAFLQDLSRKVIRGQIANAKQGNSNGGPVGFAMDRGLFDPAGELVRRLEPGETVRMAGHCVKHIRTKDQAKLAAVRYMFQRFDETTISYRALTIELQGKGFPCPTGKGWQVAAVQAMLANSTYRGTLRWGKKSTGRYHTTEGESIVKSNGRKTKPIEDAIEAKAETKIIDAKLFDRVQAKIAKRYGKRNAARTVYPLSGLMYCKHCGKLMHGSATKPKGRDRKTKYHRYVCSVYNVHGKNSETGCGHFVIDARAMEAWLVKAIQKAVLGPTRKELVRQITRDLKTKAKTGRTDAKRLQKRIETLDREITRLVKAIRTIDAPELIAELTSARGERDRIKATLAETPTTGRLSGIESEAERIADTVWELGQRLDTADPGELKETFSQVVAKITCRWDKTETKGGRTRCTLAKGEVEFRDDPRFADQSSGGAYASACAPRLNSRILTFSAADLAEIA